MTELELYDGAIMNIKIPFPTEWNDFDEVELKHLSDCLAQDKTKETLFGKILRHRLKVSGVPRDVIFRISQEDVATDALQIADKWLEDNNLTKQPYPKLGDLTGPESFDELYCGEYDDAEVLFYLYNIERDMKHLRMLAQTIWRPTDQNGKRVAYNDEYTVSKNYKSFFQKLDEPTLHLIYLWWCGSRNELKQLFPRLFQAGGTSSGDQNPYSVLSAFSDLVHEGAGARTGTINQIRNEMKLKVFLYDCERQVLKVEEMEQNMNKR